ncbi:MAG: hypothetical protein WC656_03695 [Sulfurimonas sp.]|jgi:hypothetical protein
MEIGSLLFLSFMDVIFGVKSCEEKYKADENKQKRKECIEIREANFRKLKEAYLKKLKENKKFKKMLDKYYEEYNQFIQDYLAEFVNQDMIIELQTADIRMIKKYFEELRQLKLNRDNDVPNGIKH